MRLLSLILFILLCSCTQTSTNIFKTAEKPTYRFSELKNQPFVFYGPYNGNVDLETELAAYAFNSYFKTISKYKNQIAISLQNIMEKNYSHGRMTFGVNPVSDNIIAGKNLETETSFFTNEKKPYTVLISDFKLYEGIGEQFGLFNVDILILDVDFILYDNQKSEIIETFKLSSEVNSTDLEGMKILTEQIAENFNLTIEHNGILEPEANKKKKKKAD
jgi:hypothetical protein